MATPKYKKIWTVYSQAEKRFLTWAECGRVGDKPAQTVDRNLIVKAAEGARVNGFPDAQPHQATVKAAW